MGASLPALVLFVFRVFALVDEPFGQAPTQFGVGLFVKIRVIAVRLACQKWCADSDGRRRPTAHRTCRFRPGRAQESGFVGAVLQDQVDIAAATRGRRGRFSTAISVRMCFLLSSMMAWTASKAEAVEAIFLEPVQCVVDEGSRRTGRLSSAVKI